MAESNLLGPIEGEPLGSPKVAAKDARSNEGKKSPHLRSKNFDSFEDVKHRQREDAANPPQGEQPSGLQTGSVIRPKKPGDNSKISFANPGIHNRQALESENLPDDSQKNPTLLKYKPNFDTSKRNPASPSPDSKFKDNIPKKSVPSAQDTDAADVLPS